MANPQKDKRGNWEWGKRMRRIRGARAAHKVIRDSGRRCCEEASAERARLIALGMGGIRRPVLAHLRKDVKEQKPRVDVLHSQIPATYQAAKQMAELKGMKLADYIRETIQNAAKLPQPPRPGERTYDWGVTPDGSRFHWTGVIEPRPGANRAGYSGLNGI